MTRTIDFYFEFPSPYSYLAHTQLPRIAAEHGAAVPIIHFASSN
jgi:2-hydroxychromene-2-carboxylate isomerase